MRSARWLIVVVVLLGWGCSRSAEVAKTPPDPEVAAAHKMAQLAAQQTALAELTVKEPLQHENLMIFPVVSKTPRNENPFITLDQGLRDGTVEIQEIGQGRGNRQLENVNPSSPATGNQSDTIELAEPPREDSVQTQSPTRDVETPSQTSRQSEPLTATGNQAREASPRRRAAQSGGFNPLGGALGNLQTVSPNAPPVQAIQVGLNGGNEVNRVMLINRSGKPLYLMPGEIILGGQQDRVIGTELVVQPSTTPQPINVFCVEHGRWNDRSISETVAYLQVAGATPVLVGRRSMADEGVREAAEAANQGKFVASVGNLSKAARQSLQTTQSQGEVWKSVAAVNASAGNMTTTDTFTANYGNKQSAERLEPYMKSLQAPVVETEQIVGVIVAVNGKVETLDVFQSTPLFKELWPKLLKSYALDAASAANNPAAKSADKKAPAQEPCTIKDAESFMAQAMEAKVAKSEQNAHLMLTTRDSERVVTFSADLNSDGASLTTGAPAALRGPVHTSGFAK